MNQSRKQQPTPSDKPSKAAVLPADKTAIKELFLLSALWLPMGFFLWFKFGSYWVALTAKVCSWVLTALLPNSISGITQVQHQFDINTWIPSDTLIQGQTALKVIEVNPMIYGYGLPLLFGLIMATPKLAAWQRLVQVLIGYGLLVLVQSWGVVWETLKDLALTMGPYGQQAVSETGLPVELIALCYQLGYLLLPPIAPLIIWILFNRQFVEGLVRRSRRKQRKKR